jgi:hypothetical protein
MNLKETVINLVGCFKCSIENNIVLCTGIERTLENDKGEPAADIYLFDVLDVENNTIPHSILVAFNEVNGKLLFLYKKDKYEVVSISPNLITLRKDGMEYFIERTQLPF